MSCLSVSSALVSELISLEGRHSTLRVELVVTAWARTLDWHGYASNTGLLRTAMTASERRQLSARSRIHHLWST
eukprot:428232-Rhodomonas_salina.4